MENQLNPLGYPILSIIVFTPLLGALLLLLLRGRETVRWTSLLFTSAALILSIPLVNNFDKTTHHMQFLERYLWIPSWGISYAVGIDGISILFILLTLLLSILSVLVSWTAVETKVKEFHIALLVMETAMLGVFVSLDLFLFYVFWEAMLIPMFILIGVWGGSRRVYSAIKFFLYTFVGSVLMLIGIVVLYFNGNGTLDITVLSSIQYPMKLQYWLFLAFFAAFAVKVPMFPFHTWLPDAHTEAPTAGSVILAGILIKMGAYGFLRFSIPMFPAATGVFIIPIMILSVIAIIYGALICFAQKDLKRLIAYSSVSHMGFVTLGLFAMNAQGVEGGILQMLNHGIITGALFLMVGIVYERTHTRMMTDYGGYASLMPWFSGIFIIFTLASIGLPGTNGFIGEFLIILGAFSAGKIFGVLAATGIILGAGYMLWLYQKIFFEKHDPEHSVTDINTREFLLLVPLIILVFWIGFHPGTFLDFMHVSVEHLIEEARARMDGVPMIADYVSEIVGGRL